MALMEVRYRGLSDYRILTAKDLEYQHGIAIGDHKGVPRGVADRINRDLRGVEVNPQKDLVWGPHNGHKILLDVNEDLERVLRGEEHFTLSKVDDDGNTTVVARATTSEDNPSQVRANVDGGSEQINDLEPRDTGGAEDVGDGPGPASTTGTSKGTTVGGSTAGSTSGGSSKGTTTGGSTRTS